LNIDEQRNIKRVVGYCHFERASGKKKERERYTETRFFLFLIVIKIFTNYLPLELRDEST